MNKGALFIIGGNENKGSNPEILSEFVSLSLLGKGGIGIIPTASQIPEQVGLQYKELFLRLGAERVEMINVKSREHAENAKFEELVSGLSAVFMTGGDQSRLAEIIGGTRLLNLLFEKWESGMLVAGTSAGASAIGRKMVVDANVKTSGEKPNTEIKEGFGFLENIIIDQHFSQRSRFNRLSNAIVKNRHMIGIGIDENTAILLRNNVFTVYGEHRVIVMNTNKRECSHTTVAGEKSKGLMTFGFQLHTLMKGYSFNLSSRKLLNGKEE